MYNRKINDDLVYIGASDRSKTYFEGVYPIPKGMSYNSYLMLDERCALFDTVDSSVAQRLIDNLHRSLGSRTLDYVIITHMEPDHSGTLEILLTLYPGVKVVCTAQAKAMIAQFMGYEPSGVITVKDADTLTLGRHTLRFLSAPMVHWPEVMAVVDECDGTLFSADAFGTFGALEGRLFADEVDFDCEYVDESRRYYTNIVGKYGAAVNMLLNKILKLDINTICPLHGYVWRKNIGSIVNKYLQWAAYKPEETGVCICYASIYGNTEQVAYDICARLCERRIRSTVVDLTHEHYSVAIADCFKHSHVILASITCNGTVFAPMRTFLHEYIDHGISGRKIGIIENGTWAISSGQRMREILNECKNTVIIDNVISIKSVPSEDIISKIDAFIDELMK